MAFTKGQIIMIGIGLIITVFIALLFLGIIPGLRSAETPDISGSITVWGTLDSSSVMESTLIAQYHAIHPNVAIAYTQMNPDTYEEDLINALAGGRGPDAYLIKNNWIYKQSDKLSPLGPTQYPVSNLQAAFPNVVTQDFALSSSSVYGFPLFIDTLALFYNKELFDNAGIANPPKTWEEIEAIIPRLRSVDATQKIIRSAIAIGGSSKSVTHAADILSLMLLQKGLPMNTGENLDVAFANDGESTIKRYLNFANPASDLYTWNDQMGSDIEAFAKGQTAMMIGYQADIAKIKEKNPFFQFGVTAAPQLANATLSVNYPAYWGLVVSNTSRNIGLAWDFIGTVTLNPDIISTYLTATNRTPALRSLIAEQVDNPETGFFARQALTARNWIQPDGPATEKALSQMISSVLTGKLGLNQAAQTAEEAINEIIRKRTRPE